MDQLHIVYEWRQLDYQFPSPEARQQALDADTFIPMNNLPVGLEIHGDRLFVTVPRWRYGVPSSLNYINLKGEFDLCIYIDRFSVIINVCNPVF